MTKRWHVCDSTCHPYLEKVQTKEENSREVIMKRVYEMQKCHWEKVLRNKEADDKD